MKTKLFLASALTLAVSQTVLSQTDEYGYTSVELSMGAQYANRVFFDFSENKIISQPATGWDIAFYRNSAMDFGERVNDANNVKVYQVSANPAAFDTVVPGDKANWGEPLYNPDKTDKLQNGAFDNATLLPAGGFNFSWGSYDLSTHKILGKVVFVLEYGNGDYYKFFINEYSSGYTFKYAKWNGTSWDATQTRTIASGTDDAYFNYFSFTTGAKVENIEPSKAKWDLMFTRYWTFYNNIMMYLMSGTIQSPNVTIAYVKPETQATLTYTLPSAAIFSKEITTIGHSWKPTSGVYTDVVYYIKEGSNYYRMYFTSNGGASTGNMYFKYKNITSELSVADFGKKGTFGIYPNPTKEDRKINILFDVKQADSKNGNVEIFDFTGKKVYETAINNISGFSVQEVDVKNLTAGIYLVKISYGGRTETKKLVIK